MWSDQNRAAGSDQRITAGSGAALQQEMTLNGRLTYFKSSRVMELCSCTSCEFGNPIKNEKVVFILRLRNIFNTVKHRFFYRAARLKVYEFVQPPHEHCTAIDKVSTLAALCSRCVCMDGHTHVLTKQCDTDMTECKKHAVHHINRCIHTETHTGMK